MFTVRYQALIFKPYEGEILDSVVQKADSIGFFAEVGPLLVFVPKTNLPPDITFDENSNPPVYKTDEGRKIEQGSVVRLRLVGIRPETNEIFATGTINEDYLGLM